MIEIVENENSIQFLNVNLKNKKNVKMNYDLMKNKLLEYYDEFYRNNVFNKLDNSITHLEISEYYNIEIDKLPSSLTHLKIGIDFTKIIKNYPESLRYLEFSNLYDKKAINLPESLKYLKLGNSQIFERLPNSLTHLILGDNFSQELNHLPNSLTHLSFGNIHYDITINLPNSLTHLKLGKNTLMYDLPNSLTHLIIDIETLTTINKLPDLIKNLTIYTDDITYTLERIEKYLNEIKLLKKIKYIIIQCRNYVNFNYIFKIHLNFSKCHTIIETLVFSVLTNEIKKNIMDVRTNFELLGLLIAEELAKYVFNPIRLLRYATNCNLTLHDYLDFYG